MYYSVILYDSAHCLQCTILGNCTLRKLLAVRLIFCTIYNTTHLHWAPCLQVRPTIKYNSRWQSWTYTVRCAKQIKKNDLMQTSSQPSLKHFKYRGLVSSSVPFFLIFFSWHRTVFSAAHQDTATGGSCVCLCGEESGKCSRCIEEYGWLRPCMRKPPACTQVLHSQLQTVRGHPLIN